MNAQTPWKTVWWFPEKLDIEFPYDPTILQLGTYPREMKIYVQNLYTHVHSTIIHKSQKVETTQMYVSR